MRLIKSEFEINRMREAIQISAEAHELVRKSISSKKNERQIQGLLEGFFLEKGARGPAYNCLLYTSPSPRDSASSRMPSSA